MKKKLRIKSKRYKKIINYKEVLKIKNELKKLDNSLHIEINDNFVSFNNRLKINTKYISNKNKLYLDFLNKLYITDLNITFKKINFKYIIIPYTVKNLALIFLNNNNNNINIISKKNLKLYDFFIYIKEGIKIKPFKLKFNAIIESTLSLKGSSLKTFFNLKNLNFNKNINIFKCIDILNIKLDKKTLPDNINYFLMESIDTTTNKNNIYIAKNIKKINTLYLYNFKLKKIKFTNNVKKFYIGKVNSNNIKFDNTNKIIFEHNNKIDNIDIYNAKEIKIIISDINEEEKKENFYNLLENILITLNKKNTKLILEFGQNFISHSKKISKINNLFRKIEFIVELLFKCYYKYECFEKNVIFLKNMTFSKLQLDDTKLYENLEVLDKLLKEIIDIFNNNKNKEKLQKEILKYFKNNMINLMITGIDKYLLKKKLINKKYISNTKKRKIIFI